MLQSKLIKILIVLVIITAAFSLWQIYSAPQDETMVRERHIPEENYKFLDSPLFEKLESFNRIGPIELDRSGRENPFNIY